MSKLFDSGVYRALVLTLLAGIATVTVAFANRDVYTKEQINDKLSGHGDVHDMLDREVEYMRDDIQWLVRRMGGTPSADSKADNHTP